MTDKKTNVREIYWHDANYPDETNWLSKKDVLNLIDETFKNMDWENFVESPEEDFKKELKQKIENDTKKT